MCLQCNSGPALLASQDAPCNFTREDQQNGYHVSVFEIMLQRSHFGCRGNILVTVSTTSVVIGLTWGGVQYPWSSARVLLPLIIGLIGLCVFVIYEIYFCKPPVVSPFAGKRQAFSMGFNIYFKVPIVLRMNWTGASGYIQNFLMAVVLATLSCT